MLIRVIIYIPIVVIYTIMEPFKYYVYFHIDPRNNKIRYVGKGSGDRAFRLKCRKAKHRSWLKSLENKGFRPIIEFFAFFKEENDALEAEANLIKEYLLKDSNICNFLEGGKGCPSGKNHPNFGKKHSAETKAKISKVHKGRKKDKAWRDKIGSAHKGMRRTAESIMKRILKVQKSILCIENNSTFSSVKEASRLTGVDASSIVRICKGKQQKSAKGLTFKYFYPIS